MNKLKELLRKVEVFIPTLWGWLWVIAMTIGSIGVLACITKWVLRVFGVAI